MDSVRSRVILLRFLFVAWLDATYLTMRRFRVLFPLETLTMGM